MKATSDFSLWYFDEAPVDESSDAFDYTAALGSNPVGGHDFYPQDLINRNLT